MIIASLFEKRAGPLPQHRRHHRRRRHAPRHLPEDAHPGRPALLREILLHARRPRLSRLADEVRQDRRADLLGPVVSRGRAAHGAAGARRSSSIRRRSAGTRRRRPEYGERQHAAWETIQRAHAIANGCYVAAVNRVGHESGRPGAGHRVLGPEFCRRHQRPDPRQGGAGARRRSSSSTATSPRWT